MGLEVLAEQVQHRTLSLLHSLLVLCNDADKFLNYDFRTRRFGTGSQLHFFVPRAVDLLVSDLLEEVPGVDGALVFRQVVAVALASCPQIELVREKCLSFVLG